MGPESESYWVVGLAPEEIEGSISRQRVTSKTQRALASTGGRDSPVTRAGDGPAHQLGYLGSGAFLFFNIYLTVPGLSCTMQDLVP